MELIQIPYSKLLKLEVQKLAKDVIRILGDHDTEALKLEEMQNLFLALMPEIEALKVPERGHYITSKLKSIRGKRDLYVSALAFQHRVIKKEDPTGEEDAVLMIGVELKKFFDKLRESKNEAIKNIKVDQFISEVKENAVLGEALDENGFSRIITNLEGSISILDNQLNNRSTSKSKRLKVKTKDLTKPVIEGVKNVMSEIKLTRLKNPDLDYGPLIAEMNEMLNERAILISIREAFNERKANEGLEDGVVNESTINPAAATFRQMLPPVAPMAPTTNGVSKTDVPKNGVNEKSEEVDLNLKQNQAVAKSAKQSQLPDLNSEADL